MLHTPLTGRVPAFGLLAAVALGLLAGCDTTSVDPPDASGPVVQFGATRLTAEEGTTVALPVTLTGGTGEPVSVEVLFAAGASDDGVCSELDDPNLEPCDETGADFTGFGAPDGPLLIAAVTFSGAAEETREVTFTVPEDEVLEGAEALVFALQQAEGATIGEDRTLTVTIAAQSGPTNPPIAEIRQIPNLEIVTAEGVVTRSEGRLTYIQDETAGIAIFAFDDSPFGVALSSGLIAEGDSIRVTGKLCEFGVIGFPDNIEPGTGLSQITAPSDECFSEDDVMEGEITFELLANGDPDDVPPPQTITLAQLRNAGDAYESELVRIAGLTIDPAGDFAFRAAWSYTVTDATGTGILRTPSGPDTQIAGVPIPTGPFTFEGIIGQFRLENQLTPIYPTDIIPE